MEGRATGAHKRSEVQAHVWHRSGLAVRAALVGSFVSQLDYFIQDHFALLHVHYFVKWMQFQIVSGLRYSI